MATPFDSYADALKSPPLPLVAFLGRADLHSSIGEVLRQDPRQPLNSIGLADVAGAARLFGERKPRGPLEAPPPPAGIIKSLWLAKHRQRRPAVACLFLEHAAVVGDATAFAPACAAVDAAKAAVRGRGARLVVLVVVPSDKTVGEVAEERLAALRRRAEVDTRCVAPLAPTDPNAIRRLAKLLAELSAEFYRDESRRVRARMDPAKMAPELVLRCLFKLGAYAEFRQDWAAALQAYGQAYAVLAALPSGVPLLVAAERGAVGEHVHFKLLALMLPGAPTAAATQFRAHMAAATRLPPGWPPRARVALLSSVVRQYRAFAELLQARSALQLQQQGGGGGAQQPASAVDSRELSASTWFAAAASAAQQRRWALDLYPTPVPPPPLVAIDGMGGGSTAPTVGVAGTYVGQVLMPTSGGALRPATDDEWVDHQLAAAREAGGSRAVVDLWSRAHAALGGVGGKTPGGSGRTYARVGMSLAMEHMRAGGHAVAAPLLESAASVYRRESWAVPLATALGALRECTQRLAQLHSHCHCSLELAALPCLDVAARAAIHGSAVAVLTQGVPATEAHGGGGGGGGGQRAVVEGSEPAGAPPPSQSTPHPVAVGTPLATAFACVAGFHAPSGRRGEPAWITVALCHAAPPGQGLPLESVTLRFTEAAADVTVRHAGGPPGVDGVDPPSTLALVPGAWLRITAAVTPQSSASPALELTSVIARVGPHAAFEWSFYRRAAEAHPVPTPWMVPLLWGGGAASLSTPPLGSAPRRPAPSDAVAPVGPPKSAKALAKAAAAAAIAAVVEAERVAAIAAAPPRPGRGVAGRTWLRVESPPAAAKLTLSAQTPALVGEKFVTTVVLTAPPTSPVVRPRIKVVAASGGENGPEAAARLARCVSLMSAGAAAASADYGALAAAAVAAADGGVVTSGSGLAQLPEMWITACRVISPGALWAPLPSPGGPTAILPGTAVAALPDVPAGATLEVRVMLRWPSPGSIHLAVEIAHGPPPSLGVVPSPSLKVSTRLVALAPFTVAHRLAAPFRRHTLCGPLGPPAAPGVGVPPLVTLPAGEVVTLAATVTAATAIGLQLVRLTWAPRAGGFALTWSSASSPGAQGVHLSEGEAYSEVFQLTAPAAAGDNIPLGCLEATWRREVSLCDDGDADDLTSLLPLPAVTVAPVALMAWSEQPASARVAVPFPYCVRVHNKSVLPQEVGFTVADAPGILFSGERVGTLTVLPGAVHALRLRLVPIAAGELPLPEISLTARRADASVAFAAAARIVQARMRGVFAIILALA